MRNSLNPLGSRRENINVAEDGELIHLTSETCEVFGREGRSGRVLVDGKPEIELEDIVLRDRIQLSEDGIVVPIIVLHSDTGDGSQRQDGVISAKDPLPESQLPTADSHSKTELNTGEIEIISRGFVYMDESEELIEEAKEITRRVIENLNDEQKHETETVQDEVSRRAPSVLLETNATHTAYFPVVMRV